MRIALQAADTGHLVFSTVHTTNASFTMQRLVAMFPPEERELLQTELATNLAAVISQRLAVAKQKEKGRITSLPQAIANRENGMQLFDQHLADLYKSGQISGTEALRLATNAEAVALSMRGMSTLDTSSGLVG